MDKESVQATSPKAYDQVLEYLKTLIKNKDISYGGKIPSERELMETLRISRNSVREALRILEHTGVLESRHGKGNFLVNRMGESLSSVFSMLVLMEEYSQNRLLILLMDALSEIIRSEGEVVLRQAASIDTEEWIALHKNIAICLIEGNIQEGLLALEEHYEWLERDIKM